MELNGHPYDCSVLLYEADATIGLILSQLLHRHGVSVSSAGSVDELSTLLERAAGEPGDGVAVVVGEPLARGREVERLWSLPELFPSFPFILLTTRPDAEKTGSCFRGVLPKPFLCEDLISLLRDVWQGEIM